jgi:hypothetical protein
MKSDVQHPIGRFTAWFFLAHFLLTLAMLYGIASQFSVMREPPPDPTVWTQVLGLLVRLFALPVILPLSSAGAICLVRPGVVYVLLNSFCAAAIAAAAYFLFHHRPERRPELSA